MRVEVCLRTVVDYIVGYTSDVGEKDGLQVCLRDIIIVWWVTSF